MSEFTPEQVAEWNRLSNLVVRAKGKPTPEQIQQQKDQQLAKDAFLETLGAKTKADQKKVTKALDAALKEPKSSAGAGGAAAATAAAGAGASKVNEADLDPSAYTENRLAQIAAKEAEGRYAYPHKFDVSHSHAAFLEQFKGLTTGQTLEDTTVSVAGRVQFIRAQSKKLYFIDLQSCGHKVQVMAASQTYGRSPELFARDLGEIRRGDIIGVVGSPGRTKTGELSVVPKSVDVLSPCLAMLPKTQLKDKETRYRKRYLDLIMNDSREIFYTRAKIIHYVRAFLDAQDFLEVSGCRGV
jgi:lysyl-tRNA synthetase class 2